MVRGVVRGVVEGRAVDVVMGGDGGAVRGVRAVDVVVGGAVGVVGGVVEDVVVEGTGDDDLTVLPFA